MYPNFIEDRKALGYEVLNDTNCCIKLVLITKSTVLLTRNLPSKVNHKTKRVILVIALVSGVWFSNLKSVKAIGMNIHPHMNIPPQQTLIMARQDTNKLIRPSNIDINFQKQPKIIMERMSKPGEISLPISIYFMDERFLRTPGVSETIKKLRGGSYIEVVATLVLIIIFWQMLGVGESFQLPIVHPNGAVIHPANGGIQRQLPHPKHGGKIKLKMSNSQQVSTHVVPTQTQMSGFVKNGKVDLHKCLNEVNRRASEIGCTGFECSLERFRALATENGKLTSTTAREAITILQGEMHGYYKNARRENYGPNITGPDFRVEGLGDYIDITHVEVKNPVGSAIKIANGQKGSISKQGKKIGEKLVYQQNYWSNTTKTSELENLNPTASLPQSPNNVLGEVDIFDVPTHEKALMEGSIMKGTQNNTNIVFLNYNTNI